MPINKLQFAKLNALVFHVQNIQIVKRRSNAEWQAIRLNSVSAAYRFRHRIIDCLLVTLYLIFTRVLRLSGRGVHFKRFIVLGPLFCETISCGVYKFRRIVFKFRCVMRGHYEYECKCGCSQSVINLKFLWFASRQHKSQGLFCIICPGGVPRKPNKVTVASSVRKWSLIRLPTSGGLDSK